MTSPTSTRVSSLLLAFALTLGATACPQPVDSTSPADQKRKAAAERKADNSEKRPPFPNMATPAWGKIVLEREAKAADPSLSGKGRDAALAAAQKALHSREDGSEKRLVAAAAALWRAAMDDSDRALAAALVGAGLVLDPEILNYRSRLIDAAGAVAYSMTLRGGTVVAQAGQALVMVAIGRVHQANQTLETIASNPKQEAKLDADASLLLANARFLRGQRDDAFFRDVTRALRNNVLSHRARTLKARGLLDLGYAERAADVAIEVDGIPPYLEALGVYARGLVEDADRAIAQLQTLEKKVREPERGEALFWLGRLLANAPGKEAEAKAVADQLSARPGFTAEASIIRAILALKNNDGASAYSEANAVASRTGAAPSTALDSLWLVVDACAIKGDVECVRKRGVNAVGADGNRARWAHAMATLTILGKVDPKSVTPPIDVDAMLRLAHRMSPFDPDLAKRVGDDVSSGGEALAQRVRAARAAMAAGARGLATESLSKQIPADCRVCRALLAVANPDATAGARAAILAIKGKGPQLAEDDLVAVIDVLGAVPVTGADDILYALSKDPRKSVKDAAKQAMNDLKDPAARKAREEKEKKGHAHDEHAKDGVPVPH